MTTVRMIPPLVPSDPVNPVSSTNPDLGRYHGDIVDVRLDDVVAMEALGWTRVCFSGSASERPPSVSGLMELERGDFFFATDLNKLVIYDGELWRDVGTGEAFWRYGR